MQPLTIAKFSHLSMFWWFPIMCPDLSHLFDSCPIGARLVPSTSRLLRQTERSVWRIVTGLLPEHDSPTLKSYITKSNHPRRSKQRYTSRHHHYKSRLISVMATFLQNSVLMMPTKNDLNTQLFLLLFSFFHQINLSASEVINNTETTVYLYRLCRFYITLLLGSIVCLFRTYLLSYYHSHFHKVEPEEFVDALSGCSKNVFATQDKLRVCIVCFSFTMTIALWLFYL